MKKISRLKRIWICTVCRNSRVRNADLLIDFLSGYMGNTRRIIMQLTHNSRPHSTPFPCNFLKTSISPFHAPDTHVLKIVTLVSSGNEMIHLVICSTLVEGNFNAVFVKQTPKISEFLLKVYLFRSKFKLAAFSWCSWYFAVWSVWNK